MPSERVSAGLLLFRKRGLKLEVLLAHPGGPFFKNKDDGHWSIPKGEIEKTEEFLSAAIREFREETGIEIDPQSHFLDLGSIRQKGGKTVHAFAVEGDCPANHCLQSNSFKMEWPPRSGQFQEFPEIDRAEFFEIEPAKAKINAAQIPFLDRLVAKKA